MTDKVHRILLAGLSGADARPLADAMATMGYDPEIVTDPMVAVAAARERRFSAVVAAYPLPPGTLGSLVTAMRASGSINHGAGLVLLASPDRVRAAAGLVGRGVNKVLSLSEEPVVTAIVVNQLVERFQPMAERLPVRVRVEIDSGDRRQVLRTENLSGLGMLVSSDAAPGLGDRVRFRLHLEGEPVAGEAKVVRHAQSGRESATGFGARFLGFDGDGHERLVAFLRATRQIRGRSVASG